MILVGCSSFKSQLIEIGKKNEAIYNAIIDFSNSSQLYKKHTVFNVKIYNLDTAFVAVSIIDNNIKILLTTDVKVGSKGYAPSKFIEKEGKLFYWWDDNYSLTKEALEIFSEYDIIQDDEGGIITFPDHEIDDKSKGVDYYFCKNDLRRYKKVTTSIGVGWYDPPKLDCQN